MNSRRRLAFALGAALMVPARSFAQAAKPSRIGFLSSETASDPTQARRLEAFESSLRGLGYNAGKNIVIETRWAEGRYDRLPALAAQLIALNVQVIVVSGTQALLASSRATTSIPIVMGSSGDAIALGVTTSLARPSGNVTGWSFFGTEVASKLVELLREAAPRIGKVGFLTNPAQTAYYLPAMQRTAGSLNLGLSTFEVRAPAEFDSVFARMAEAGCDAVLVQSASMFFGNVKTIAQLALKHRLPSASSIYEFAESGGLIAYGPDRTEGYRRAAVFVDKILKGARPASLPIEQASKFEFFINMTTAKSLGLAIPQPLQARARLI